MRLTTRAVALTAALAAVLAGCGRVDVNSPRIRGVGFIRLDEIVKHHPLYGELARLDDSIAAINLAAAAPAVPRSPAELKRDTAKLVAEMKAAESRTTAILVQKQYEYLRKEQAAEAAALVAAGEGNAGAAAAQQMSATSVQQAQAAARAANAGYLAYQRSVIAQNSAAMQSISNQLQRAAARKYQAMAARLQQNEAALSLQISQQDASERLSIKTRLANLALDDATRTQLRDRLQALDQQESSALRTQRDRDQRQLSAYRAELQKQMAAQIDAQATRLRSQTQAQLEVKRNEVTAELRSLGPAPLPTNLKPATKAEIAQIRQQFNAEYQADAQQTINDYNATRLDLERQYEALQGADVGATGAAAKQLAGLQQRRSDLYDKIVAQIQSETARIARERGLKVVFADVEATPGGYDLTNEVTEDIESLHE